MTKELVIQGGLVQEREVTILRQIPLEKLTPHLVQVKPVTIPVLPRTSVFVHTEETATRKVVYFLCETPAGIRNITKENKAGGNKRRYRLAFPWTYFFVSAVAEGVNLDRFAITNWKAFHSRVQFNGLPGEFYVAFLPNIYKDTGEICFGSAGGPLGSLADQVDHIVNNFYVTEFNDHLDRNDMVFPFGGNSFKGWVDATNDRGASAWKDFPEWDTGVRKKFTLPDLLGAGVARSEKIEGTTVIPEIPSPMTFGRAEEWWRTITPQDRGRLKIALGNIVEDDPDAIDTPIEIMEVADDGGVPV